MCIKCTNRYSRSQLISARPQFVSFVLSFFEACCSRFCIAMISLHISFPLLCGMSGVAFSCFAVCYFFSGVVSLYALLTSFRVALLSLF